MVRKDNLLIFVLLMVLISQGLTFFVLFQLQGQLRESFESDININNRELQSQINELTMVVSSLSETNINLREEINTIEIRTSDDFSGIIEQEIRGVVTIRTDVSQGSGFLVSGDGFILTNAHILDGASLAVVYLFDGERYNSKLIGVDDSADVALLKIEGEFDSLSLGDSDAVGIGDRVIAIGNPLGLSFSVTEGIISGIDREGDNNLPYYFQTDASLNPGNSGGPLINTEGEVIGINNFKVSGAESLGFALEINPAKKIVNDISEEVLGERVL